MGVDFMGHGGASLNWSAWRACFILARAFGWKPAGTLAPTFYAGCDVTQDYRDCKGGYFSNDGQQVTDEDAKALGLALQRGISADRMGEELTNEQTEALRDVHGVALISQVADFAARGGFSIY